jgi:hypothetical protein
MFLPQKEIPFVYLNTFWGNTAKSSSIMILEGVLRGERETESVISQNIFYSQFSGFFEKTEQKQAFKLFQQRCSQQ